MQIVEIPLTEYKRIKSVVPKPILELAALWAACTQCIKKLRSGTLGALPLPLIRNLNRSPTRKTQGHRVSCGINSQPPRGHVEIGTQGLSSAEDATNPAVATQPPTASASYISCEDGAGSAAPPPVQTSVPSPISKASPSSSTEDPLIIDLASPSVQCVINEVLKRPTFTNSGTSESDCPSESVGTTSVTPALSEVKPTSRITMGLLALSLNQAGLIISLREVAGAENYLKALETDNGSRVVCNHVECRGEWDPDVYCLPGGQETATAAAKESGMPFLQLKSSLPKVFIAPSRVGGIRVYGSDGMVVYRNTGLARSGRLQRFATIF